jgi:pimeloyl-ACP methyl ester carboxylesterase
LKAAIDTRELISVSVDGVCLRGTYHPPRQDGLAKRNRTGLFFLNPGFLPRAGIGDLAVSLADSFAKTGYPCFRFDVPGLGDSDGESTAELLDFINAGGYAPFLSSTVDQLVERFNLSGMVFVGQCAGSVSTLYAAPVTKGCSGLVMLDPYFHLPVFRPKLRDGLSSWASSSWLGGQLSKVFDQLKRVRRLIQGRRLPGNANLPLIRCWKQVACAGMPILIMKAPAVKATSIKGRPGDFDYFAYVQGLAGRNSRVALKFIEGSNHSFADRRGREAFQQYTQEWLNTYFPPIVPDEAKPPEPARARTETGNLENVAADYQQDQKIRQEPQPYAHG